MNPLLAAVEEGTTVDASLIVVVNGIKAQLDEVLSGTSIPPAVLARVDSLFDKVTAQNKAVADTAVNVATPDAPANPDA